MGKRDKAFFQHGNHKVLKGISKAGIIRFCLAGHDMIQRILKKLLQWEIQVRVCLSTCPGTGADRVKTAKADEQINTWTRCKQRGKGMIPGLRTGRIRFTFSSKILAKWRDASELINRFPLAQGLKRYLIFPFFQPRK